MRGIGERSQRRRARRRGRPGGGRWVRRLAVALAFVMVVTLVSPSGNVTKYGPISVSWSGLFSWFTAPRVWASPVNPVPLENWVTQSDVRSV
jgi:hypothetical protein